MFLTVGLHQEPRVAAPPAPQTREAGREKLSEGGRDQGTTAWSAFWGGQGSALNIRTLNLGGTWVPGKGAAVLGYVSVSE